jgi:hypothetical protein
MITLTSQHRPSRPATGGTPQFQLVVRPLEVVGEESGDNSQMRRATHGVHQQEDAT